MSVMNSSAAYLPVPTGSVKDSRWLTLEVCREYQRNKCSRTENECKFAHPPPHVEVQNGRVICCYDSIKGKCQRREPPCKYLHPPQHLREQLLQNGRNNLILKNIQLQILQQQLLAQGGIVQLPSAYDVMAQSKGLYSPSAASGMASPGPTYSMLHLNSASPVKNQPYLSSANGHLPAGASPSPGGAAGPPSFGPPTLFSPATISMLSPAGATSEGLLTASPAGINMAVAAAAAVAIANGGGQNPAAGASQPAYGPPLHHMTNGSNGGPAMMNGGAAHVSLANAGMMSQQNKSVNMAAYSAAMAAKRASLGSSDGGKGSAGGASGLTIGYGGPPPPPVSMSLAYQNYPAAAAAMAAMQIPSAHHHQPQFLQAAPTNAYHIEIPQFGFP